MEFLSTNAEGRSTLRRVTRNGREYIVAPLSLIVPGVLAGSKGALYYPPDEIARNHRDWQDIPLVVYHPTHNGENVSARFPGVLEVSGVGFVHRPKIEKDGSLRAEGWFDVAKVQKVDNRVYQALLKGDCIELSTGLFTDNEEASQGANHKGRGYQYIARNYRPDHLAVLPDQVGACSVNDGCGVNVNAGMRKKDRKGFDSHADRLERPKIGSKVVHPDHGPGTVEELGPFHTWMKKDSDQSVVKVKHDELKRDELGRFASNEAAPTENCGGPGSGVPGPCPKNDPHQTARAHHAAAAFRLAKAAANYARTGSQKHHELYKSAHNDYKARAKEIKRLGPAPKVAPKGKTPTGKASAKSAAQQAAKVAATTKTDSVGSRPVSSRTDAIQKAHGGDFVGHVIRQHQVAFPSDAAKVIAGRSQAGRPAPGDEALSRHLHQQTLEKLQNPDKSTKRWLAEKLPQFADAHAATAGGRGKLTPDEFSHLARQHKGFNIVKNKLLDGIHNKIETWLRMGEELGLLDETTENQSRHQDSGQFLNKKGAGVKQTHSAAKKGAGVDRTGTDVDRLSQTGKHGVEADEEDDHTPEAIEEGADDMEEDGATQNCMTENDHDGECDDEYEENEGTPEESLPSTPAPASSTPKKDKPTKPTKSKPAAVSGSAEAKTRVEEYKDTVKSPNNNSESPVTQGANMTKAQKVKILTANCKCQDADEAVLNELSDETLDALVTNAKAEGSNADTTGGSGKAQAGGKGTKEEYNENEDKKKKEEDDEEYMEDDEEETTENKRMTVDQWLKSMPEEARPVWNMMKEASDREKASVVKLLVANVSDPKDRAAKAQKLMKKDINDLREMLELLPKPVKNSRLDINRDMPIYLGMGGGPVDNSRDDASDDILETPTMNWDEERKAMNGLFEKTRR